MSEQKMQMQMLIQQGSGVITMSQGAVPVIGFPMTDCYSNSVESVVCAVNFLRSGCPIVQMQGGGNSDLWRASRAYIECQFSGLKMSSEKFHISSEDKTYVITVRREELKK